MSHSWEKVEGIEAEEYRPRHRIPSRYDRYEPMEPYGRPRVTYEQPHYDPRYDREYHDYDFEHGPRPPRRIYGRELFEDEISAYEVRAIRWSDTS